MDARYPIGKMEMPKEITAAKRQQAIASIAATPKNLREAVRGLNDAQLDTPYRDGGWTGRQVVHHVPDSHMNAYVRLKLALTEVKPTIKPYEENAWAELADSKGAPIEASQRLLEALHERWDRLWRSLKAEDFSRKLVHPDSGERNIDWLLFVYKSNGGSQRAHIPDVRKR